jgi:acyl-CoA synthetase (AMP-forming)/AMP-acid ligase II
MSGPTAVTGDYATLGELILAAVDQIGDHEAFVEVATGERVTFRELADRSVSLASHLRTQGVGRGDVLAVCLAPSIDFAVACYAGALLGAIVTGVNTRLGPREILAIFDRCQPAAVVIDPSFQLPDGHHPLVVARADLQRLGQLTADVASASGRSWPGEPNQEGIQPEGVAASASASLARWKLPVEQQTSDPAVIIWTSGTTGIPKGAWLDHANLAAAVQTAGDMTLAFDRRISGIPMAHAGFMAKLWEQWAMAITFVLTPNPWSAHVMLDVLSTERITVGGGVPTQWAKLLELPAVAGADFSALRICLAATAPAAPELIERMRGMLGAPVIVRYAMTESPSIAGTRTDDPSDVQYRTVGRPQDGVRIRLVDSAGAEVRLGEVGRVRVNGPCVMRGYWNDPAMTAAAFDDEGWLISGDLGYLDSDGNLVLVGRLGDMYIRGGYNVYPLEVENVLAEHPGVITAAVIGVATPVMGEIGRAYVVAADPADPPTLAELRRWVDDRLADYKRPDEVVLRDSLPLTAMGKVDKAALTALG